jgi:glutamate--cysteine ligase
MKINKDFIIKYFEKGAKKLSDCGVGVEHEKLLFFSNNNKRIDYATILKIFNALYEFGWQPIYEGKNIIALQKDNKNISLEPGNQIELSGAKLKNIHQVCSESQDYLFELKEVTKSLDVSIVSSGFDPISKLSEINSNPKQRYKLMNKEMPKNGKMSLDMMYRTCGTQVNLDYTSEKDFSKKFYVANRIVPIIIALFANSSIVEKNYSKFLSYRSYVWQSTSRGGLPKTFLEEMNFEKYSDFIINFPMLFIKKNNEFINPEGRKFSDFLGGRIKGIGKPDVSDLEDHLSTIFTENRLKTYIETRTMDACGWDCLCAGPAFLIGLMYGNLEEVFDLVKKWDVSDILSAYINAPKDGFKTNLGNKDLLHWSAILLNISREGLANRNALNKKKINESKFLSHLENIIKFKNNNAENVLSKFNNNKDLNFFYEK